MTPQGSTSNLVLPFAGKSSLLAVLGNREVPIQSHIDIYYLSREMPASEKTALEAVMEADSERIKLERLAEELATIEDDDSQDYLMEVRGTLFRPAQFYPPPFGKLHSVTAPQ